MNFGEREVAFTMCNPPFYSSREDVAASAEAKEFERNAVCLHTHLAPMKFLNFVKVCTGADVEMITAGGESVLWSTKVSKLELVAGE